jgi:hypothetical protein
VSYECPGRARLMASPRHNRPIRGRAMKLYYVLLISLTLAGAFGAKVALSSINAEACSSSDCSRP